MPNQSETIVHVVDDDAAVRHSLRRMLETVPYRVATYADAQEFLDGLDPAAPGCLVVDVRMPGMDGIELQRRLISQGHATPVIIITGHGDVPMAVDSMQRGAVDFIEKPFRSQLLLDRVADAIALDAGNRRVAEQRSQARARVDRLTPREREVMALVVKGMPNKQIAIALGVADKTVENHRASVMEKTHVGSLANLVRLALLASESESPSPDHRHDPTSRAIAEFA